MNPLKELQKYGQSFWLDYIRRNLITSGELKRMVEEDGLRGVTSNPSIFQKAIAGSTDYDDAITGLLNTNPHMELRSIFETLAFKDIQMAADVLRPVYDATDGDDGLVSIELSPDLARDTEGSINEARRFWKEVNRHNILIKVPATPEGIPTIEKLIAEGINVNITLMFSLSHYDAVSEAYIRGLERCSDPHKVASVASFFVSRVDRLVDNELEKIGTPEALALRGKIAIANSKMAYKLFKEKFSGPRWERLAKRGARVQRVLWASTSTKNPTYSDVLYVESLIGSDTVNTMPPVTINAFRDHGNVRSTIEEGLDEAEAELRRLTELGIDLDAITEKLQKDGIDAFANSFNDLLTALDEKRHSILVGKKDRLILNLGNYQTRVNDRLKLWKDLNFSRRLWAKDTSLWFPETMPEISDRLGWLALPEMMHEQLDELVSFAKEVKDEGIRHAVLLGMGGSSLAPEIFQKTFGNAPGHPKLIVLDSTHPDAVRLIENKIDPSNTLFLVCSKSGTTLETLSFFRYFWKQVSEVTDTPGHHFVAITDPGTPLVQLAHERGFRRVFQANPDVGGRYSALTFFGLVPAALIGVNIHHLLDRAWIASENCAFCVPEQESLGLILGTALGELNRDGRDKTTIFATPSLKSFPAWLEQLIAESTGKTGKGIVPIDEPPMSPEVYGEDRLFVGLFLEGDNNNELDEKLKALESANHPTIRINLMEKTDMGQEIFNWEVAIASAGALLGIHPFNQPDVQLAKDLARDAMKESGEAAMQDEGDIDTVSVKDNAILAQALKDWLAQAKDGDYAAIHAYLSPTPDTTAMLQKIRIELLKRRRLATTLGYGPRFLHSTGQLHKGGPNTGHFLQLVDEPAEDIPVPETDYTFGALIHAQTVGDYRALKQRGRRVLRINLKDDVAGGLARLMELIRDLD